jgi:hypothetical protein
MVIGGAKVIKTLQIFITIASDNWGEDDFTY